MLASLPLWELDSQMQTALSLLSSSDKNMYNFNHYVTCYDDREGRIKFLLRLIKDEKIAVLHVAPNFENDTELNDVLGRKKRDFLYLFPDQEDSPATEPEVLTDDMEVVSGAVEVTNPRWEHKDEDKKSNAPDKASVGDTIILMADITNLPEGASITFDIFDTSGASPFRIKTVNGKNVSGVGKGEWVIEDPNHQGEKLKLGFETIARSRATEKCEIGLMFGIGLFFQIDLDNPHSEDDKIILQDTEGNEIETFLLKNQKEVMNDYIKLVFTKIVDNRKYNLIFDPGKEGLPYPVFCDVDADFLKGKN